jgi:hypothetical protein
VGGDSGGRVSVQDWPLKTLLRKPAAFAVLAALWLAPMGSAHADGTPAASGGGVVTHDEAEASANPEEEAPPPSEAQILAADIRAHALTKTGYVQLFATSFFGDGLRFNNPYRLQTILGKNAMSVSRTAAYVDVGLAAAVGDPMGFQHDLAVRISIAAEGVPQGVLAPAYMLWRRWGALAAYARASVPIVLTPSVTAGIEGGLGGVWFFRSGIGVIAEIVGDVFYGAGTREVAIPAYPVLSGQLGLMIAYEVLP